MPTTELVQTHSKLSSSNYWRKPPMQEFHHSQSWQGKNKKHKLMWNWASKRERQVGDKQNSHSQNEQPRQQDAELVQTRCCGAAIKISTFSQVPSKYGTKWDYFKEIAQAGSLVAHGTSLWYDGKSTWDMLTQRATMTELRSRRAP